MYGWNVSTFPADDVAETTGDMVGWLFSLAFEFEAF